MSGDEPILEYESDFVDRCHYRHFAVSVLGRHGVTVGIEVSQTQRIDVGRLDPPSIELPLGNESIFA